ncbi:DUF4238 domain-containing protein [Mucilaginibacter sp. HD30]
MDQHLISQVYLKQFGYQDKNAQWRVAVLEKSKFHLMSKNNKRWIAHKSVGSLLARNDFFDFDGPKGDPFVRIIESANSEVETRLPELYQELAARGPLSNKGESILAHFASNLFVRTSYFDAWLADIISVGGFQRLLDECLWYHADADQVMFKKMMNHPDFESRKNQTNMLRFLFWDYFLHRLGNFQYYILEPYPGKFWITCDNPVVVLNHVNEFSVIAFETEIVFPINSQKLVLFKMERSNKISRIFEGAVFKGTTVASSELTEEITHIISGTAEDMVIIPHMQDHREF